MPTIQIHLDGFFSRERLARIKKRMGQAMFMQVTRRIEEGGDEEYRFAPLDFPRVTGETDHPLQDTGRHLLSSLSPGQDGAAVWVGTNFIGARVQQFGTSGKGGMLPPIRPVMAEALFLPISPRGKKSTAYSAPYAPRLKRLRAYSPKGKKKAKPLKQGVLDPQNEAEHATNAKADFLLVQEVNIRGREFMRFSEANKRELIEVFKERV